MPPQAIELGLTFDNVAVVTTGGTGTAGVLKDISLP